MSEAKFTKVERFDGSVWVRDDAPVWIVHYPKTLARAAHYQAYRAVQRVPAGRMPWSIDNRRLSQDGFPTLKSAMRAAEQV